MILLDVFIKFMKLFKPQSFNDPYLFLLNQFGHICISFVFCYLTNSPYFVLYFWIFWEVMHLIASKDIVDFFEDLFFEIMGVILFLLLFIATFKIWLLTTLLGLMAYTYNKFNR